MNIFVNLRFIKTFHGSSSSVSVFWDAHVFTPNPEIPASYNYLFERTLF